VSYLLWIFVPSFPEASSTPVASTLPTKGTYTLIIFLSKEIRIKVGQLGVKSFAKGYYTYTGSALGTGASGLTRRVSRHLRKTGKKRHWHIDFLLAQGDASVTAVVAAQTDGKMECELNCYIKMHGATTIPVSGFGSSDCNENCQSHLLFFPDITEESILAKKIVGCHEALGCDPILLLARTCPSRLRNTLKKKNEKYC
jgi:Uri superfamily endonuclease